MFGFGWVFVLVVVLHFIFFVCLLFKAVFVQNLSQDV